jgi:hypothetical protein
VTVVETASEENELSEVAATSASELGVEETSSETRLLVLSTGVGIVTLSEAVGSSEVVCSVGASMSMVRVLDKEL